MVNCAANSISETFNLFATKFKQLQNVSLNNDTIVVIIKKTEMNLDNLTPGENAEVKYTFFSLPFTYFRA